MPTGPVIPLVPDRSLFEIEIGIARLEMYKSPGSGQISAELIQAGGEILWSEIHILINSVWNKKELSHQWMESRIIVQIYKKGPVEGSCENSDDTSGSIKCWEVLE
jgi:hypothetical protein